MIFRIIFLFLYFIHIFPIIIEINYYYPPLKSILLHFNYEFIIVILKLYPNIRYYNFSIDCIINQSILIFIIITRTYNLQIIIKVNYYFQYSTIK